MDHVVEFYRKLNSVNSNNFLMNGCLMNDRLMAMTVIEGPHLGKKGLMSGQKLIWESEEDGLWEEHEALLGEINEQGIYQISGESVYAEVVGKEKKLVVCGGGHVAVPIIRIGRMLGFHVTAIEDRESFAENTRAAGASKVCLDSFEHALSKIPGDEDTYFIIVTRGHRQDHDCLRLIVEKPHAYIGMIGSRTKTRMVKELLIETGTSPDKFEDLHAPIGLDIGARTPEEIAVSVMAEIIEVKNKTRKSCEYSDEIMKEILSREGDGSLVLATIIERHGSAPREAGARMLVLSDGRFLGTIGGGSGEANVLKRARAKLANHESGLELLDVDLTAPSAEEEGMICGGQITVMLEMI